METTSTTRPYQFSGTMRTILMTMGFALLFLSTTHPVGAQQQLPPGTAGTAQAEACGVMGGHATVEVNRTANGISGTFVMCGIKGLGGWWCVNTYASTTCQPMPQASEQPSRWLEAVTGDVLPILETGTVAQMQSAVAVFQARPLVQAELSRAENAGSTTQGQPASGKDRQDHKSNKHK